MEEPPKSILEGIKRLRLGGLKDIHMPQLEEWNIVQIISLLHIAKALAVHHTFEDHGSWTNPPDFTQSEFRREVVRHMCYNIWHHGILCVSTLDDSNWSK